MESDDEVSMCSHSWRDNQAPQVTQKDHWVSPNMPLINNNDDDDDDDDDVDVDVDMMMIMMIITMMMMMLI